MTCLTVLGRTARRGGQVVAELTYGGSAMITVSLPDGTVIGRLFRTGKHTRRYDVWTALHTAAPVPSDARLAQSLPIDEAIARLTGDHRNE